MQMDRRHAQQGARDLWREGFETDPHGSSLRAPRGLLLHVLNEAVGHTQEPLRHHGIEVLAVSLGNPVAEDRAVCGNCAVTCRGEPAENVFDGHAP